MLDDPDACYRAIASRDARFDGQFVTAVTSTGIYCRPSCPAQTPRRENVRFYRFAAAAVAAGFRACKRCRPEAAPGSREWDARGDLAARALRAISAGLVDDGGVPALARSLSVSERHLHRVLVAEVGAGPLALARTRRAQTARLLLDATTLPVTDVAHAAGFASIRQFNDTMRAHFGAAPTALRRAPSTAGGSATLTLRLAHRSPYAVEPMQDWLRHHAVPGLEGVEGESYLRVMPGGAVAQLTPGDGGWTLQVRLADIAQVADVVARCRRLLDSDAHPSAVDAALGADPRLRPLIQARPGLRVPGAVDGFELAVRTVLGQQVSVAAAATFTRRLLLAYGEPLAEPVGAVTHRFPTAALLADASYDGIGITGSRIRCLRALAAAAAGEGLTLDPGADREQTRRALMELPGIGPWTTDYLVMRALGDPDVFVRDDLVLRRAAAGHSPATWSPWRSYAALHLWTDYLANPVTRTSRRTA